MSEVKRWIIVPYDQYSVDERTSPNGEWVKWEDYEALAAERDRLAEENARLRASQSILPHALAKLQYEFEKSVGTRPPMLDMCDCGFSSPCMWGQCKHPLRAALDALDLTPDPRVAALVEVAKEVGRISDRDHVAWRRLADALAALEGGDK